jgi:hypothetical protein
MFPTISLTEYDSRNYKQEKKIYIYIFMKKRIYNLLILEPTLFNNLINYLIHKKYLFKL